MLDIGRGGGVNACVICIQIISCIQMYVIVCCIITVNILIPGPQGRTVLSY